MSHVVRFVRISKPFFDIVEMRAKSDDRCKVVMRGLSELRDRNDKSACESNEPVDPPAVQRQVRMTVRF